MRSLEVLIVPRSESEFFADSVPTQRLGPSSSSRAKPTYQAKATSEVILCARVVQTPQVLVVSGIGNPEVLSAAGINTIVESHPAGANFQDHVLGGMVFECAPEVLSLDALHGDEYGQKQQMIYEREHTGPFGSPACSWASSPTLLSSARKNYNQPSSK